MCNGACIKEESPDVYNARVSKALKNVSLAGDSYLIKDVGRDRDEFSAIWIQNGAYKGFGFFSHDVHDPQLIKEGITQAMDNRDVIMIIKSYLSRHSLPIIPIENTRDKGELF